MTASIRIERGQVSGLCQRATFPRLCGRSCRSQRNSPKRTGLSIQTGDSRLADCSFRLWRSKPSAFARSWPWASSAMPSRDWSALLRSAPAAHPAESVGRAARWRVRIARQRREPRQRLRQNKSRSVISFTTPRKDLRSTPGGRGAEPFIRPLLFGVSTPDAPGHRKYNLRSPYSHEGARPHKCLD